MIQANVQLLKPYEFVLSKPQFNHFSGFVNALQVCEKSSVTRFAQLHNKDRSCMDRFLTESPWEVKSLEPVYKSQISEYFEEGSSLLIDDTLSHRPYAKKVEKANYHFDHTNSKQSLGYCILTSTIITSKAQIPYKIEPYYRKVDCEDIEFRNKNEMTRDIILSTKDDVRIKYVIFDTWFSNAIVIGACKESKKHYISQVKSNRNVTIGHKKRFVREHADEIKDGDWEIYTHENTIMRVFGTSAFIPKIGSVHLIFSQLFDEKKSVWSDTHYIISDLMTVQSPEIIVMYLQRVGIESFHREAKQNTGLEGYFLRKRRGIERYLFLVMLAYSHLVLQSIKMEESKTIGEMSEIRKKEVFMDSFDKIQKNPELKEVICMKLAKARV